MKGLRVCLTAIFLVGALSGCQAPAPPPEPEPVASVTPKALSGRITFAGSTSLQPLVNVLGSSFILVQPDLILDVAAGGSVVGIEAIHKGTVDIGMASRQLTEEEAADIGVHQIATDALVVVVNAANPLPTLSLAQLKAIYLGDVTDWVQLGSNPGTIKVVMREETSGTRGAFDHIVLDGGTPSAPGIVTAITAADAARMVAEDPLAIGYVGFGNIDDGLRPVPVDGVMPSEQSVADGTYGLARPLLLLTGPLSQPAALAFVDYALSPEGQAIVRQSGWVPVR